MTIELRIQQPNPKSFKYSLAYYYSGRWFAATGLFGVAFLGFGNSVNGYSQTISIWLLIMYSTYLIIPAKFYMQNYYLFFINSWFTGLTVVVLYAYSVIINLSYLKNYISNIDIFIYIVFILVFILEIYQKHTKLHTFIELIKKSIKEKTFFLEIWFLDLEDSDVDKGMHTAMLIGLIIIGIVILVGSVFGGGLMTAKILLSNGFDTIVEIVIGFGMLSFGMLVLSRFTNETLKLIAAYKVQKDFKY